MSDDKMITPDNLFAPKRFEIGKQAVSSKIKRQGRKVQREQKGIL
jgi:hypothetical protein